MLINGIIWLVAAMFAMYNAMVKDGAGNWVLIAVVFAAVGIRQIVKHFKDQKKERED